MKKADLVEEEAVAESEPSISKVHPVTACEHYRRALGAIRMRHEKRPAWYKQVLFYETKWWVTPFTHKQMEGNRLATLRLIDDALSETFNEKQNTDLIQEKEND